MFEQIHGDGECDLARAGGTSGVAGCMTTAERLWIAVFLWGSRRYRGQSDFGTSMYGVLSVLKAAIVVDFRYRFFEHIVSSRNQ